MAYAARHVYRISRRPQAHGLHLIWPPRLCTQNRGVCGHWQLAAVQPDYSSNAAIGSEGVPGSAEEPWHFPQQPQQRPNWRSPLRMLLTVRDSLRGGWGFLGEAWGTLEDLTWPPVENIAMLCGVVLCTGGVLLSLFSFLDGLCMAVVSRFVARLRPA